MSVLVSQDSNCLPISDGEGDHPWTTRLRVVDGGVMTQVCDSYPSTAFGGPPPHAAHGEASQP
jgi:hypothetical protein